MEAIWIYSPSWVPSADVNLGIVLSAQGRQEEANTAFRAALQDGTSYQYSLQAARRLKEAGKGGHTAAVRISYHNVCSD